MNRKTILKIADSLIKKSDVGNMSFEDMVRVMKSLKEGDNIMIVADSKRREKDNIMLEVAYSVASHGPAPIIGIKLRRGKAVHPATKPGVISAYDDKSVVWQPTMLTQIMPVYSIDKL